MSQVDSPKLTYREEIDGLRAIAVLGVILYHAEMVVFGRDWFEGGFIGVDIFFVISGYLITRIILSELQAKGSFSFLNFYERRARRILPMLFVVIFVSIPYAWQKLLPSDFVEYAESILASLFFGSNFFFYFSTTEYGADSALLKPFLHTWSLGVEEQFYLVFPLIAIVAFKFFRQHFLTILVGLSLLSLQFAELMEVRNSDLNFYLPFGRFWELAIGSILAYRELNYKVLDEGIGKRMLPMLGLYLIAYSILFFDSKTPHPSFHTLIPIVGVALIIGFASKDELVGKLLGSKPFVWVGLISYSAYLWHFPIFAFSRMGKEPTNYDKFEWIALTLTLSILSYFYVEKPLRNRKTLPGSFFSASMTAIFVICVFCLSVFLNDGFSKRFSDQVPYLLKNIEIDNRKLSKNSWSILRSRLVKSEDFNGAHRKVLVVGNSHAKDVFNALEQNKESIKDTDFLRLGKSSNFQISCFDESVSEFSKKRKWFYGSSAYINSTTIIVSTSWRDPNWCDKARNDWPISSDYEGVKYLIKRSKLDGKKIILMGQSPRFSGSENPKETIVDLVLKDIDLNAETTINSLKETIAQRLFQSLDLEMSNKAFNTLNQISNDLEVPLYDKLRVVCDVKNKICDGLTDANEKIFYDKHHYTLEGAKHIGLKLVNDHAFTTLIQ